jgi:hypothetical protein
MRWSADIALEAIFETNENPYSNESVLDITHDYQ